MLQEIGWKHDDFDWVWVDTATEDELYSLMLMESLQSWNLESGARGGVMRARMTSRGVLHVWMHHIVSDEWSMRVMEEDLLGNASSRSVVAALEMWEFAEWEWELLQRECESMASHRWLFLTRSWQ